MTLAVINSFGQFLKYVVSVADAPPTTQISTEISTSLPVTSVVLPINVKNKKNQLFNDILHFLDSFAVTVEDSNKDTQLCCSRILIGILKVTITFLSSML